jgi:hypothetical protein
MKKWLMVLILGLLWGCSASVMETEEAIVETEVSVLVLTYVDGLEASLKQFLNRPFEVVRSIDGIDFQDYERIMVLYDDNLRRVFPPFTFYGPRLDYPNVVTYTHPDGMDVTMIYLQSRDDYLELFEQIDQRIFQIQEPQIVYELYPLAGTVVHVDSAEFDEQLLLEALPLGASLAPKGNSLRWFYTSKDVYLFLGTNFPSYLSAYADQIRSLNAGVIVIHTERGQRLIIGRAIGQNAATSYHLFLEALAIGIEESMALTPPPPPVIPLQEGRLAPPEACILRDKRGPVYPTNVPQPTTVSHDIPQRRLPTVGQIVGLNVMIGFDEFPQLVTKEQYRLIIQRALDSSDAFYEEMSNGQLNFEWRFHPDIVTIPFFLEPGMGPGTREFEQRVLESLELVTAIVEETTDLTDIDVIQYFWPIGTPDEVYGGIEILLNERMETQRGNIYNFNVRKLEMRHFQDPDSLQIYHGIGHNLGFTDIYLFNFMPEFQGKPRHYYYGNWDIMTDALNEFNGWHRWMATWVRDEQVHCVPLTSQSEYEVDLSPLNDDEAETRLIVISLSETQAISIELRGPGTYCPASPWRSNYMDLLQGGCNQNILVTHIDAMVGNGWGPKRILRPARSTQANYSDSLLLQGEFVTYQNITITHTERRSTGSTVTIRFD